jgi:hypothetical protein
MAQSRLDASFCSVKSFQVGLLISRNADFKGGRIDEA